MAEHSDFLIETYQEESRGWKSGSRVEIPGYKVRAIRSSVTVYYDTSKLVQRL